MKAAFTLIELIFVIIIIAILGAIALPYFNNYRQNSTLARAKADVALIQSALAYARTQNFIANSSLAISVLDEAAINRGGEKLFYCTSAQISNCSGTNCCVVSVLSSPIYSSVKGWMKTGTQNYRFYLNSKNFIDFKFDADDGVLECENSTLCKEIM